MISHDSGVILVNVPFSGADVFENCYIKKNDESCISSYDTKKLSQNEPLQHASLGRTINQFYDYSLFSIVKSPYLRAYEIWKKGQSNLKKEKMGKQDLGEYFENMLNGWNCIPEDKVESQSVYLQSNDNSYFGYNNVEFKVEELFHYENLIKNELTDINDFLEENQMRPLTYFVDPDFNEDWSEYYDKNAIEIINYVFEEDFAYCGYRKL